MKIKATLNGKVLEVGLTVQCVIGLQRLEGEERFLEGFAELIPAVTYDGVEQPTADLPFDVFLEIVRILPERIAQAMEQKKSS